MQLIPLGAKGRAAQQPPVQNVSAAMSLRDKLKAERLGKPPAEEVGASAADVAMDELAEFPVDILDAFSDMEPVAVVADPSSAQVRDILLGKAVKLEM